MASRAPALPRSPPAAALRCRPPSPSRCRVPPNLLLRCRVPPLLPSPRRLCRSAAAPVLAVRAASPASPSASVEEDDAPNLPCGTCNSKGWLLCDFCEGQKTNVQLRANKFYRRCPSCRALDCVGEVNFCVRNAVTSQYSGCSTSLRLRYGMTSSSELRHRLVLLFVHNVKFSSVSHFPMVLMDIDIMKLILRTEPMTRSFSRRSKRLERLKSH